MWIGDVASSVYLNVGSICAAIEWHVVSVGSWNACTIGLSWSHFSYCHLFAFLRLDHHPNFIFTADHISVNSISIFPLVSWGKSLNLCVLQKLTAEKDNIDLLRMLLGLILDLDLIDHRYLLPHEPICSLAERVIWDQVLHEDVLLATLGHWACADPICGAAETALQALIAARAEATWCHCRTLDKFRAELAFERGW